ncbi:hypothetical protein SCNU_05766 [Gordonia neofelifaecis NRRL B-59395]|uniref:Uncharacterized protein n=1 Tax=Gordonia neofelifaecis NRRL B-59395 TaxID=644548 RepID=F1YGK3_9ACTN|nr:hypothetical protein SCNU_05766 [Gordonia neofelifaecis NRRL B-59395]
MKAEWALGKVLLNRPGFTATGRHLAVTELRQQGGDLLVSGSFSPDNAAHSGFISSS